MTERDGVTDDEFRRMYFKNKKPSVQLTQFFTSDPKPHQDWMEEDLARSGIEPHEIMGVVDGTEKPNGDSLASYKIPYFALDGTTLEGMHRIRYKRPPFSKESRYLQPSTEALVRHGLPPNVPYIHPAVHLLGGTEVFCAEGEKKSLAILKRLGLPAFGIGGCHMWRHPTERGTLHPWIRELLDKRGADTLVIVPDGDLFRYDICSAYGSFARAAVNAGYKVRILNPPNKIDDLLLEWGPEAHSHFREIKSANLDDLVQPASALIEEFGLAFRLGAKGEKVVFQHSANVMRLMEGHRAFPRIWRNNDTNRVMVGENTATPDATEMDIANYLQYHLGFDKITHRNVYPIIQALAKRNEKSPFLNYVRGLDWDGEPRLSFWLQRLWGVPDSDYIQEVGSKWLISACARMDKPGTKLDWIMIVVGPQSTGKTSMPGIMFNGNSMTMYGDHNDKDLHMLLHSALCVGFDELDSFSKRDASTLKAMITRNEDAFRPPYGASVEIFPRRFTLYGCGNRYEFLQHDPSGYRRYAIVEVGRLLDFAGLEAERDQLWAEAWHRYSAGGVKFWEVEGASENAEKYTIPNPIVDKIQNWIWMQEGKPNCLSEVVYFTMTQLLIGIDMERDSKNPHVTREIAAIIRALGAEQKNTRGEVAPGVRGRYYTCPLQQ